MPLFWLLFFLGTPHFLRKVVLSRLALFVLIKPHEKQPRSTINTFLLSLYLGPLLGQNRQQCEQWVICRITHNTPICRWFKILVLLVKVRMLESKLICSFATTFLGIVGGLILQTIVFSVMILSVIVQNWIASIEIDGILLLVEILQAKFDGPLNCGVITALFTVFSF